MLFHYFDFFYFSFQADYEEKTMRDVCLKCYEPPKSLVQSVLEARAMRVHELQLVSQLFEP